MYIYDITVHMFFFNVRYPIKIINSTTIAGNAQSFGYFRLNNSVGIYRESFIVYIIIIIQNVVEPILYK